MLLRKKESCCRSTSAALLGFCFVQKFFLVCVVIAPALSEADAATSSPESRATYKNAYATMMYMGTPRDREFYIAARVMMQSLIRLNVNADLVVISSKDVPQKWTQTLRNDGVRVLSVDNIPNPYKNQPHFNRRFLLTLNKLYAWSLVEYERVVMLDADNLFLKNTDELFQCGQFCAAFINPCIFHTGLFVLEPSKETYHELLHGLNTIENDDGADQGYLTAYFHDLLERPMYHPPANGSRLDGFYRLPLGYQMDASYYYLKLRWNVPCGPNSVITFPGVPWLKPWYWWSWPVLPLGLSWHEKRMSTIGYGSELLLLASEAVFYIIAISVASCSRRMVQQLEKMQTGRLCPCKGIRGTHFSMSNPFTIKALALLTVVGSFLIPFFITPRTIHPIIGWGVFLLGSLCLLVVNIIVLHLPVPPVLTPWIGIIGALVVLSFPFYSNGIVRAILIGAYAFFASPLLWWGVKEVSASIDLDTEQESLRLWTNLRSELQQGEVMKIC